MLTQTAHHDRTQYNHPTGDSLVIEVLSLAVDLIFQGEVKGDMLYFLLDEYLGT